MVHDGTTHVQDGSDEAIGDAINLVTMSRNKSLLGRLLNHLSSGEHDVRHLYQCVRRHRATCTVARSNVLSVG